MSRKIPKLPKAVAAYIAKPPFGPGVISRTTLTSNAQSYREQMADPNSLVRKSFLAAAFTYYVLRELEELVIAREIAGQQQEAQEWSVLLRLLISKMPDSMPANAGIDPTDDTHDYDPSKEDDAGTESDDDAFVEKQKLLPEYIELVSALDEQDEEYLKELGLNSKPDENINALLNHEKSVEDVFINQPDKLLAFKQLSERVMKHLNEHEPEFAIAANYLAPAALAAVVYSVENIMDIAESTIEKFARALEKKAKQIANMGDKVQGYFENALSVDGSAVQDYFEKTLSKTQIHAEPEQLKRTLGPSP